MTSFIQFMYTQLQQKQESFPVGCVLSTRQPYVFQWPTLGVSTGTARLGGYTYPMMHIHTLPHGTSTLTLASGKPTTSLWHTHPFSGIPTSLGPGWDTSPSIPIPNWYPPTWDQVYPPLSPVDRQTQFCENITFTQLHCGR